jgi:outer membrane protein OmpA-like peptidoglycan-associated protein
MNRIRLLTVDWIAAAIGTLRVPAIDQERLIRCHRSAVKRRIAEDLSCIDLFQESCMNAIARARVSAAVLVGLVSVSAANFAYAADGAPASTAATRIPFVVDLLTVRAVSTPEGDYEALRVVQAIDTWGYRVVTSGEVPGDDGGQLVKVAVPRKVLAEDQKSARKMRPYFHTGDAQAFPGTVPGFSLAEFTDLRNTGKVAYTKVDVGVLFGMSIVKGEYPCELTRVAGPSPMLTVLVNGRSTKLPTIHAKGSCGGEGGRQAQDYFVLDDPANPIPLKWSSGKDSSLVLRIEFPVPKAAPDSIETLLSRNEVAQVYGIYFSFNSADIRPESERILKEIAGVLQAHPDWKLQVDGHTDGIGNDAANLDLSKRRSAAVKAALVSRHGIAEGRLSTAGHGESSPQATNDTAEGRARNRRVELRRT